MPTTWRSEDVEPADAAWAMSATGRAALRDLVEDTSPDPLAVATSLRRRGLSPSTAATVQSVATASRDAVAAGHPVGSWWTPAGLEQASHPAVAAWRARRYAGLATVDLTAGCGGDALALAGEDVGALVATEADPARVPLLRANLPDSVPVLRADATRPPLRPSSWAAWADPGRRVAGRRVRGLGDTRPAVPALSALGFTGLGVAVSPAVDLDDPARPGAAELEFVQVDRQLVEATLWLGPLRDRGPGERAAASATLLPGGAHRRGRPGEPSGEVADVGEWLALPAPALVRARLVDTVATEVGLVRIAHRRALFTAADPVASPWFRCERVEAVVTARPTRVRDALRGMDPQPLELVTHGMSVDVPGWWRALGAPDRGPTGRAIHLVRLDRTSVAVLTRRGAG